MRRDHDDEPVFRRSEWGTTRYVYNPRNPIGLALIIGSLLFAVGALYHLRASSSWSEGELRDAVHSAAGALESEDQKFASWTGGYGSMIRDAIEDSGEGPSTGGAVSVSEVDDTYDQDADATVDRFEVSTEDVDTVYCLGVSPPEPEPTLDSVELTLTVTVDEGRCP
ncbi:MULTISPECIES: hypothetical protein [unclassified Streptomyces]|uniref:hypothetical protein n=1 Tax=unclassified Streptomyces TaxID=2593676 RepID=UPI0011CA6CDC|nr:MULTISPECIES: hypothetical protein [unclassified Streptomyces]TXS20339.1 hypothetical protein EAO68_00220 [Streptomyces sp. wa22]WSQ76346.1 hypothetical protein OG725_04240 [Streptomyces sp. NBC_01213]WSQ83593.1 hypothetical protein OG722_04195 [Streptomyces sp. NBC_01212]WSR10377.1 hypothetical protein OG265_32120 [Streptomyces sp. NBC_01208]